MSITKDNAKLLAAKFSFDSYDAQCLGRGSSGSVFEFSEGYVIKIFSEDKEGQEDFDRERAIFSELQSQVLSRYIVYFVEAWEDGLILERLCSNLRSRLRDKNQYVKSETRQRWIVEAYRGLEFLHEKGIMHGDVGCHNYLVDHEGHIKLCDFAGSMRRGVRGETARICYEIRGQHPQYRSGEATPKTEIFALGSTMFEIFTSSPPYSAEPNATVLKKYQLGDFPLQDLKCPAVRTLVEKCWRGEYVRVSDIDADLKDIQGDDLVADDS
ncbi:kinase-like protein [Cadophora sp. DSE1049]|nr:kinase-like protein [Cadophora sp. DSE1049]